MATIKKNALCDLGVSCKELYLAIKGLGTDKLKYFTFDQIVLYLYNYLCTWLSPRNSHI